MHEVRCTMRAVRPSTCSRASRVMHDNAGHTRQQAAPLGGGAVKGHQQSGRDMQPLRLTSDPKAGFVHVLDWRLGDMVAHGFDEGPQPFGAILADASDGGGRQCDTEEVGDQRGHPLLG